MRADIHNVGRTPVVALHFALPPIPFLFPDGKVFVAQPSFSGLLILFRPNRTRHFLFRLTEPRPLKLSRQNRFSALYTRGERTNV